MSFQPINGKLPGIMVPWDQALQLPSNHDLHVVEVSEWSPDRRPRGRYIQSLGMHKRNSDASILEAVQISLNFCDWKRGDPGQNLRLFPQGQFPHPHASDRVDLRHCVTLGIQHPGLPTSMLMSCSEAVQLHVLDVNQYLDQEGMQPLEELLRRRAAGAWFLDHQDRPLDASLPLFPPDIETELSFREGSQRLAVTFSFPVLEDGRLDMENVSISESVVQCGSLLAPDSAGRMLLGRRDGGETGKLLRRLAVSTEKFEDAEIAAASLAALEHLDIDFASDFGRDEDDSYTALAAVRFLRTLTHIVDRHVGRLLLGSAAWSGLLGSCTNAGDVEPTISVRRSHARPDPSTWKVVERLLRVRPEDRNKPVSVCSLLQALRDILQQPNLSYAVRHGFQSSFIRRLRAILPHAYYEVVDAAMVAEEPSMSLPGAICESSKEEPLFQVTAPLQRNLDILGMRALKYHISWKAVCPHLDLSQRELEEAVARANARPSSVFLGETCEGKSPPNNWIVLPTFLRWPMAGKMGRSSASTFAG